MLQRQKKGGEMTLLPTADGQRLPLCSSVPILLSLLLVGRTGRSGSSAPWDGPGTAEKSAFL